MSHTNVSVLLKKANELSSQISDLFENKQQQQLWVPWHDLLDVYRKIILTDLEFALDHKVEQDLWNIVFKNQISSIQARARDKSLSSEKRHESAYCLTVFLEIAAGVYLEFFQQICSAFKLDIAMRRDGAAFGISRQMSSPIKSKNAKISSSLYICQYCLVHLGDIARYRQEDADSKTYYRHAARLVSENGQPYNQLAILAAAKGNKLSAVFYYVRAIAVRYPFPSAKTNLEKLLNKTVEEKLDLKGKLSTGEMTCVFLQYHASIYFRVGLERLRNLSVKFLTSLYQQLSSQYVTPFEIIEYVAITIYAFEHVVGDPIDTEVLQETLFGFLVSLLEHLLQCTPKLENKCRHSLTLPAVKVLLDWFCSDEKQLKNPKIRMSPAWQYLAKVLTYIQTDDGDELPDTCKRFARAPLPEEVELQGFLYLDKAYNGLDYQSISCSLITNDDEVVLRCYRLLKLGKRIAQLDDSLLLCQELSNGRLLFTNPQNPMKVPAADVEEGFQDDDELTVEPRRREGRTNVAIQTIIKNKAAEERKALEEAPDRTSHYDLTASYAGKQLKFSPREHLRQNGSKKPPNLPPRLERLQKSLGRVRSPEGEDPLSVSWPRTVRNHGYPPRYYDSANERAGDEVVSRNDSDWRQNADVRYMMPRMSRGIDGRYPLPPPPPGIMYPPPTNVPPPGFPVHPGYPAYPRGALDSYHRFQRPLPPPPGVFMRSQEPEPLARSSRDQFVPPTTFYENPSPSLDASPRRVPTTEDMTQPVKLYLPGPGNDDKWRFDPKTDTPKSKDSEKSGEEGEAFELFPEKSPEWPVEFGPSPITESLPDPTVAAPRFLADDVLKSIWTAPDAVVESEQHSPS